MKKARGYRPIAVVAKVTLGGFWADTEELNAMSNAEVLELIHEDITAFLEEAEWQIERDGRIDVIQWQAQETAKGGGKALVNYQGDRNTKQPRCMVCARFVDTMQATSHYTSDSPFTVETFEWECERCQMREYSVLSNAKEHGGKAL